MKQANSRNCPKTTSSDYYPIKPLSELLGHNFNFAFREKHENLDFFYYKYLNFCALMHDCEHVPVSEIEAQRLGRDIIVDEFREYFARLRERYKRIDDEWKKNERYILGFDFTYPYYSSSSTRCGDDYSNRVEGQHRIVAAYIVAEFEKDNVNIRFYEATYTFSLPAIYKFPFPDQDPITLVCSFVVFSEDGLSHFQNMPVPPEVAPALLHNVHTASFSRSGGGRPTDLSHIEKPSKICWRNMNCEKYLTRLISTTSGASNFWRMLLQKLGRLLRHYCEKCVGSFNQSQILQKGLYPYFTMYVNALLKSDTLMQSVDSLYFSFSLLQSQKAIEWNSSRWFY
jgi:hypothetical protein